MMVPNYQKLMLPALEVLKTGEMLHVRECAKRIADRINLPSESRELTLPSGGQSYLENRTAWTLWYLQQAGLLTRPKRGHYQITQEGTKALASNPMVVDNKFLAKYPSFVERVLKPKAVVDGERSGTDGGSGKEMDPIKTPDERIGTAFLELREALVTELLDQLAKIDPFRFEQVVLDLLVGMGYGGSRNEAAEVTQKTNDEGIDGVINEDRLGLDVIYIQAKRWKGNVGRQEIQNFVGALAGKKANKGIFITTSDFNANAREYAAGLHQKVILIGGRRLAELMIDHNIGVTVERTYEVKRVDGDYLSETG